MIQFKCKNFYFSIMDTYNYVYYRSNPKDHRIVAELISAYSQFDQAKAQLYPLICLLN